LPSSSHADKSDGDGNNTGNGIGKDVVGDKVGDGKGDKGNHHQCHCRQPSSSLLLPPQLPNAVALSAAIAAAAAITHLFDASIKRQWHWQWQRKRWLWGQGWRASDSGGDNMRNCNGNKVAGGKESDGKQQER
jgi:hypothetical protein